MSPLYRIARRKDQRNQQDGRTVKYLAVCKDPRIQRMILQSASDSVYKSICNAFYNVAENPGINLSERQRRNFQKHRRLIEKLIQTKQKIARKRQLVQHGGGIFLAAVLPAVISTALSFLGTSFFSGKQREQQ